MTFRVLSVCTGNICRSPVAELLLAEALRPVLGVSVASAGTGALVGHGVPEPAQRLADAAGVETAQHKARQIDSEMIREADLILGMARDHRRYVVETLPTVMRRAFTLRELARIAEASLPNVRDAVRDAGATTPVAGMRAAVGYAASMRGTVPPPAQPEDFDVIDPYRRSDEVYRQSFDTLKPAVDSVAAYLLTAAQAANS